MDLIRWFGAVALGAGLLAGWPAGAQPASPQPASPQPTPLWRVATPAEQARDAAAFEGVGQHIAERLADVQSVVVVLRGRVVYQYFRDGDPERLRDTQSVAKSALATLAGITLQQGQLTSLDQPVVALVPEWAGLNPDPRAAAITVRHLLTMTAGFELNDPTGTAPPGRPDAAWKRPLGAAPGKKFAYDNALVPVLSFVLEKAAGMPLADHARKHLVAPLGMAEPSYQRGLHLRTADMARLGQLWLDQGRWDGVQLLPEDFALAGSQPQNAGGPPASLPYGYMWWSIPSAAPRRAFMASGYGGQLVWVHPGQSLVVAATATVSPASQQRGQVLQLLRSHLLAGVERRNKLD